MTSEGGAVSARDPRARLEEALADNASLRRHASSVAHDFNNLLAVIIVHGNDAEAPSPGRSAAA